jgi:hypothetical protein
MVVFFDPVLQITKANLKPHRTVLEIEPLMIFDLKRRSEGQHISSRLKVLPSCLDPSFCVLVKVLDYSSNTMLGSACFADLLILGIL